MTESASPMTLPDLLRALEKSRDLRALARECGLSVRELRRRLASWRQELESGATPASAEANPGEPVAADEPWPELAAAGDLQKSPLPAKGSRVLEIWTDGASRGNPGPAAIGIVFGQKDGPLLCSHAETIGRATNNVAEYRAVVRALELCRVWKIQRVMLRLDSELIARQLTGAYRVKSPDLRPLFQQAVFLSRGLKSFRVRHIPRSENQHADFLAGRALRKR